MENHKHSKGINAPAPSQAPVTTSKENEFLPLSPEENSFDPVKGEKALWQAVITQALMDARCESKKSEAIEQKRQALAWLRGLSADFILVCCNADMDPSYVRRKCKEAIARQCKWRADSAPKPAPATLIVN